MSGITAGAAILAALLFACFCAAAGIRALRPKRGTLEWIDGFLPPRFSPCQNAAIRKRDVLFWLIPAAVAAATALAENALTVGISSAESAFFHAAPAVFTASVVYFLLRLETNSTAFALCGASLAALTAFCLLPAHVFLAVALLLVRLWLGGGGWWMLFMSGAALGISSAFEPTCRLLVIPTEALIVCGLCLRRRDDSVSVTETVLSPVLPLLAFALAAPLCFLPTALYAGLGFPGCLADSRFWYGVILSVFEPLRFLPVFGIADPWLFFNGLCNLPCLALSAAGAAFSLAGVLIRRTENALFVFAVCVSCIVLFFFGTNALALSGALAAASAAELLHSRGRKGSAGICAALPLAGAVACAAAIILMYYSIR